MPQARLQADAIGLPTNRRQIEQKIAALIDLLDTLDGDTDLEPDLGSGDDREGDDCDLEDTADAEPSKINRLIDSNTMSDGVTDHLINAARNLRFDIAKAHAKTAQDVAAKALFFIEDYCDVGPCEEFATAMRASLQEDFLRLGGVA